MHKHAFTLVEIMVAVSIIALLSIGSAVSFGNQRAKARDAKRADDIDTIQTALEVYIDAKSEPKATWEYSPGGDDSGGWDYSSMPTAGPNGGPFMKFLSDEGYINKVPVDPINDYHPSDNSGGYGYQYYYFKTDPRYDVNGFKTYTLRAVKMETNTTNTGYTKIPVVPR